MRVLVCIPCLLTGGTEIQTLSLVEALVAAGHEPTVVAYFEHAEGMVERYRQAGAQVRLLSPDGVRPAGIRATARFLWRGLRNAVHEMRPDVAHVQYMAPGAMVVVMLKALGVKKIVATTHTAADIYGKAGLAIIRLLTSICLDAFQCITLRAERSYFGSAQLFDGTLPRNKHFTIYNNLPAHISILEEPRQPLSADQPITVGVVSRLEPIKGMDLVVPAFAEAAKRESRLRLLVVGDGSQRGLMEQQAQVRGVADRVEFVGRQPQAELQSYYDQIDILLMPSRSEGFGLTAIEGMARGCVPVVANIGGLPEVVIDGVCGCLHESESIDDIANKILYLIKYPDYITLMSANALKQIQQFDKVQFDGKIALLYSKLSNNR